METMDITDRCYIQSIAARRSLLKGKELSSPFRGEENGNYVKHVNKLIYQHTNYLIAFLIQFKEKLQSLYTSMFTHQNRISCKSQRQGGIAEGKTYFSCSFFKRRYVSRGVTTWNTPQALTHTTGFK